MPRRTKRPPMTRDGKGARCAYCDRVLESVTSLSCVAATRDHVEPKSRGGTHRVWCCRQCNTLKGDMSPEQWLAFRVSNPRWWRMPEFQVGTRRVMPRSDPTMSVI